MNDYLKAEVRQWLPWTVTCCFLATLVLLGPIHSALNGSPQTQDALIIEEIDARAAAHPAQQPTTKPSNAESERTGWRDRNGKQIPKAELESMFARAECPRPAHWQVTPDMRRRDLANLPRMQQADFDALQDSNQRTVVLITSLHCKACDEMTKLFRRLPEMLAQGVQIKVIVRDELPNCLSYRFSVRSFPTLLILEGTDEIEYLVGSQSWSIEPPCATERNLNMVKDFLEPHGLWRQ